MEKRAFSIPKSASKFSNSFVSFGIDVFLALEIVAAIESNFSETIFISCCLFAITSSAFST